MAPEPLGWASLMVKNLLILPCDDKFVAAKDFSCSPDGHYTCAAKREDGLWVVLYFTPSNTFPVKSVPHALVLGLTLASQPPQPYYVGYPEGEADKQPRVYWGKRMGESFNTINHDELRWFDGEPAYPASLDDKAYVIQGTRMSEPCDEVLPPLQFVAGRILYRARFGGKVVLFWGTARSRPCDQIAVPISNDKEILAGGIEGTKLYRLSFKLK
ncbi:MAG: hypothetical protein Q8K55_01030 [Gemmatimonadaceae bacterium]|nr:hypothetical protein [Gemmatimonadaceae bacterium]